MAKLSSTTAILVDANGFEKRMSIPMVGDMVQPTIVMDDKRALSRAMLGRHDPDTLPLNPHKVFRLEFRYTRKWAVEGTETFPVYEEVL